MYVKFHNPLWQRCAHILLIIGPVHCLLSLSRADVIPRLSSIVSGHRWQEIGDRNRLFRHATTTLVDQWCLCCMIFPSSAIMRSKNIPINVGNFNFVQKLSCKTMWPLYQTTAFTWLRAIFLSMSIVNISFIWQQLTSEWCSTYPKCCTEVVLLLQRMKTISAYRYR